MLLRNVSPYGDLDVPLLRRVVARGEEFEVTGEQARVLLAQEENYEPADAGAKRAAPKKTKSKSDDSEDSE